MAEPRDRIERAVDIGEVFARRRSGPLGVLSDEARELLGSPVQQAVTRRPMGVGVTTSTARAVRLRRGVGFRTPRSSIRRGRNLYRASAPGSENTPMTTSAMGRGRGRASGSVLPSWYPRIPLQDITAPVRAIERRRARLGEGEGLEIESPRLGEGEGLEIESLVSQSGRVHNSNVSSGVQLEHNFSTPASTARLKPCPPSVRNVSKILLNVTNQNTKESEFLTPQKKLLNSIDTVEKEVMAELQKMKTTPSARKAERKKKVRTLMSMR